MMGGHNLKAGAEAGGTFSTTLSQDIPPAGSPSAGASPAEIVSPARATRATALPRCSLAGRRAAISTSTRRSHAVGLLGLLRPRRLEDRPEADLESRSALRLRRAALGDAGSHELLGPGGAVAHTGARLRYSRRHQVRGQQPAFAVRRRHEQRAAAPRLRARRRSEDLHPRGYGLFYTLSRATVFGHTGGGFNVNSTPTFTLDSNATRYATLANPYPNGMLLPPGRSQGDSTFIGLGAGTILPSNNRNPEYHLECVGPARGRLELDRRGQLHRQPRHAPVPSDHDPDAAGSSVLVDGAHGVERCRAESVLRIITDPQATARTGRRAAVPAVAAHAALQRRQRRTSEPPRGDSSYHALQKWDKRFSRVQRPRPLHLVEDDRQRPHSSGNVSWLGGSTSVQNIWDLDSERPLGA